MGAIALVFIANFSNKLFLSNEIHFPLNGYVTLQNFRILSLDIAEMIVGKSLLQFGKHYDLALMVFGLFHSSFKNIRLKVPLISDLYYP